MDGVGWGIYRGEERRKIELHVRGGQRRGGGVFHLKELREVSLENSCFLLSKMNE
jgi:hypothetical protein